MSLSSRDLILRFQVYSPDAQVSSTKTTSTGNIFICDSMLIKFIDFVRRRRRQRQKRQRAANETRDTHFYL